MTPIDVRLVSIPMVFCCAAMILLPASRAIGSIVVDSTERTVGMNLSVGSRVPFDLFDVRTTSETGFWKSSVDGKFSPSTFSIATQSSTVGHAGFSGSHHVSTLATLEPGISHATASANSRADIVFSVSRTTAFFLTASYEYGAVGDLVMRDVPFLSVAGTSLFLPSNDGQGQFGLTIVLSPGTYTFVAVATLSGAAGGPGFDGGANTVGGSLGLNYSFAVIPAPAAASLFAILTIAGPRRRRRSRSDAS